MKHRSRWRRLPVEKIPTTIVVNREPHGKPSVNTVFFVVRHPSGIQCRYKCGVQCGIKTSKALDYNKICISAG